MFRRHIQIVRERWTRISFRGSSLSRCLACRHAPELITVAEAAVRAHIPAEQLEAWIASGLISSWDAGDLRLVCVRCVHEVEKEK